MAVVALWTVTAKEFYRFGKIMQVHINKKEHKDKAMLCIHKTIYLFICFVGWTGIE